MIEDSSNHRRGRAKIAIEAYDKNGELQHEFETSQECQEFFDVSSTMITNCIKLKRPINGFLLKKKKPDQIIIKATITAESYDEFIEAIDRLKQKLKEEAFTIKSKNTIRGQIIDIQDKFTLKHYK